GPFFTAHEKEEVLSIRQKNRPAMALFLIAIAQLSDLPGRPAARRYLVEGRKLAQCKQDDSVRTPRSPTGLCCHVSQDLDEISLKVEPLQLAPGKEPYRAAVGGPEGKFAVIGSRKNSSFSCIIQAAKPKANFSMTVPYRGHKLPPVRGESG